VLAPNPQRLLHDYTPIRGLIVTIRHETHMIWPVLALTSVFDRLVTGPRGHDNPGALALGHKYNYSPEDDSNQHSNDDGPAEVILQTTMRASNCSSGVGRSCAGVRAGPENQDPDENIEN
jgi:hypothetical protein